MSAIDRKLNQWAQAGLLNADQAAAIREYESRASGGRSWVLFGIMIIGISAIAIGVVSVIAANWQAISPSMKLGVYILAQLAVGAMLFKTLTDAGGLPPGRRVFAREGLIGFFALLFFAGIGLTAQIFNIRSDGWSGILFWCALALPVTLFATTRPLNYFWMAMLMVAESIWYVSKVDHIRDVHAATNYTFMAALSLYLYLAAGVFSVGRIYLPKFLGEAARVISFLTVFIGGTVLGNVLWYLGTEKVYREAGSDLDVLLRLQYVPWLGALLVTPALLLRTPAWDKRLNRIFIIILFGLALFVTLPVMLHLDSHKVIGTVITIAIWWVAAIGAVYSGNKRIFDGITLAITLRLLVIYFEVFGSMMATGAGLILSGILTLAIAWAWYKFRDRLAGLVQRN